MHPCSLLYYKKPCLFTWAITPLETQQQTWPLNWMNVPLLSRWAMEKVFWRKHFFVQTLGLWQQKRSARSLVRVQFTICWISTWGGNLSQLLTVQFNPDSEGYDVVIKNDYRCILMCLDIQRGFEMMFGNIYASLKLITHEEPWKCSLSWLSSHIIKCGFI